MSERTTFEPALDRRQPSGYHAPPAGFGPPGGRRVSDMTRRIFLGLAAVALAGGLPGCVERRYVIESDPPGALVLVNGQPIGTTPVDGYFTYYGTYNFTLIKDGYETKRVSQRIASPWYELPVVDFV